MQAPQPGSYPAQPHMGAPHMPVTHQAPAYQPSPQIPVPNVAGATGPVQIVCPYCKASGMTNTVKQASSMQWIICVLCFFFCFPCTCSPFYIPSCYKITHSCQFCKSQIGTNNK
ncbi:unnamed protein product [Moneuplotes crassus]|uniref:LITAF domain-containing protein n=1 Tax=Euplotes crassus TaxID=5936 RepID=A0AAD2D2Q6_EUPCR|nr:unnamed protein product [Moneuplotes crassus]